MHSQLGEISFRRSSSNHYPSRQNTTHRETKTKLQQFSLLNERRAEIARLSSNNTNNARRQDTTARRLETWRREVSSSYDAPLPVLFIRYCCCRRCYCCCLAIHLVVEAIHLVVEVLHRVHLHGEKKTNTAGTKIAQGAPMAAHQKTSGSRPGEQKNAGGQWPRPAHHHWARLRLPPAPRSPMGTENTRER